jgi:hypothetical protein
MSIMEFPKKQRGRSGRNIERCGKNRTFRIRASMDERLIEAATAAKRSVSEEIERRIDRSFQVEALITILLNAVDGLRDPK